MFLSESVCITSITELSQNFFNSDPLKFDKYFAITPGYQKYCLGANLPTRFIITLAKEAMLIHDIAIHLLAGGIKLTTGVVKGICSIASGILGIETDHQTPSKQAVVHIGFACIYFVDFFVSITNINKAYPQYLADKIEKFFTGFLRKTNKNVIIRDIIVSNPEIEQELKETQEKLERSNEELERSNEEFIQLGKKIEKITQNLKKPSQCERIVDNIFKPDTNAILAKARSSIENNQTQQLGTVHTGEQTVNNWFESENGINEIINSFTQNKESVPSPHKPQSYLFIDVDDLLEKSLMQKEGDIEENLNFSSSSKEQNSDEILTIPTTDLSLTTLNKPENPKIEVKSTPQISKNPRKKSSLNNNLPQISTRARGLEYANGRRNRSKKNSAS